jgi:nucleoside-diphosphate-sugar epimerase
VINSLKDKRVLVTGGAGLMGSHIAEQAARKGTKEVVVLDNFVRGRRENLSETMANAKVTVVNGDVLDDVFNIATGVETSLTDLALTLLKVMGSDLKPEHGPERKVSPVPRRLADTSKARRVLGFEAEIGLKQGLRELVQWWKKERKLTDVNVA